MKKCLLMFWIFLFSIGFAVAQSELKGDRKEAGTEMKKTGKKAAKKIKKVTKKAGKAVSKEAKEMKKAVRPKKQIKSVKKLKTQKL